MSAVTYARVSTEEQARSGLSLDHQQRQLDLYCELHQIDVVEKVVDAGASGKTLRRPGFQRVSELVRDGGADTIVIYRIDRLTRSVRDFANLVAELDARNVALRSVSDHLDTSTPSGRLITHVMVSFAEFEREQIGQRVKDALSEARERGTFLGQPPVGYRVRDGKLVPNERYPVVAMAHDLRNQGLTLREIGSHLQTSGIRTTTGLLTWSPKQVSRLLAAPLHASEGADQ